MILWVPKKIEEGESHLPFFYPEGASLNKKGGGFVTDVRPDANWFLIRKSGKTLQLEEKRPISL